MLEGNILTKDAKCHTESDFIKNINMTVYSILKNDVITI